MPDKPLETGLSRPQKSKNVDLKKISKISPKFPALNLPGKNVENAQLTASDEMRAAEYVSEFRETELKLHRQIVDAVEKEKDELNKQFSAEFGFKAVENFRNALTDAKLKRSTLIGAGLDANSDIPKIDENAVLRKAQIDADKLTGFHRERFRDLGKRITPSTAGVPKVNYLTRDWTAQVEFSDDPSVRYVERPRYIRSGHHHSHGGKGDYKLPSSGANHETGRVRSNLLWGLFGADDNDSFWSSGNAWVQIPIWLNEGEQFTAEVILAQLNTLCRLQRWDELGWSWLFAKSFGFVNIALNNVQREGRLWEYDQNALFRTAEYGSGRYPAGYSASFSASYQGIHWLTVGIRTFFFGLSNDTSVRVEQNCDWIVEQILLRQPQ